MESTLKSVSVEEKYSAEEMVISNLGIQNSVKIKTISLLHRHLKKKKKKHKGVHVLQKYLRGKEPRLYIASGDDICCKSQMGWKHFIFDEITRQKLSPEVCRRRTSHD